MLWPHSVHESIVNIKSHVGESACQFEFCKLLELDVRNKIESLKCSKFAGHDGIQYKSLKMGGEKSLCLLFTFPMAVKMAEIFPVYKKLDNLFKKNYRSVNLLIMFSKLFERLMAEQ